jgi:hypothetical protein
MLHTLECGKLKGITMSMNTNKKFAILEMANGICIETHDSIDELAYAAMYKTWARNNFSEEALNLLQSKINAMREEALNAGSLD